MDLHLHTSLFCVKFADDSSFEGSGNSRESAEQTVNNELIQISTWFKNNRLTLHPGKSRCMIHSRDKLMRIMIDGVEVQRCGYGLQEESVKLLGVKIDENLDWREHVREVEKKIAKGNYLLWRHKKKLNLSIKRLIYESFVRSHLLYCISVWGGASNVVLKPLDKAVHKVWKKIGNYKMHTLDRLKSNNLLKIEDELAVQEAKIVWKWEKQKIPKGLAEIIKEKTDNLRGRRFEKQRNAKASSISIRLANRAQQEIHSISNSKTKKGLTTSLRKQLFEAKYRFTCTQRNCYICSD